MTATVSTRNPFSHAMSGLFESLSSLLGPADAQSTTVLPPEFAEQADTILASEDLAAINDRLDEITDGLFAEVEAHAPDGQGKTDDGTLARALAYAEREANEARPRLEPILGAGPFEVWHDGMLAGWAVLRLLDHARKRPVAREQKGAKRRFSLYDSNIPLIVRSTVWRLARSLVAMIPVQRAYDLQRKLDPWMALALAAAFAEGTNGVFENFDKMRASPGLLEIPYSLRDETLEQWVNEAKEKGLDIYFPLRDGERG